MTAQLTILGPTARTKATVAVTPAGIEVAFWRCASGERRGPAAPVVWARTDREVFRDEPFHRLVDCAHDLLWSPPR